MPAIDGLQINDWSRAILLECQAGGIDAVNATCAVWEGEVETRAQVAALRRLCEDNADVAAIVGSAAEIEALDGRVGILPGFQNCSPFEDRLELVGAFHDAGVRVAQLTYNTRNLVGGSCYDAEDEGLTPFGRAVIEEMHRVGMLVDLSHVGDRTCREAIDASPGPVAITHANPRSYKDVPRNKPDDVLRAVAERGGVIGVCLYPAVAHADRDGFAAMVAGLVDMVGVEHVAVGTDCTRGWGRDYLLYLRAGRREPLAGEELPEWPAWPAWFQGPTDWPVLRELVPDERVLGATWLRLLREVIG